MKNRTDLNTGRRPIENNYEKEMTELPPARSSSRSQSEQGNVRLTVRDDLSQAGSDSQRSVSKTMVHESEKEIYAAHEGLVQIYEQQQKQSVIDIHSKESSEIGESVEERYMNPYPLFGPLSPKL